MPEKRSGNVSRIYRHALKPGLNYCLYLYFIYVSHISGPRSNQCQLPAKPPTAHRLQLLRGAVPDPPRPHPVWRCTPARKIFYFFKNIFSGYRGGIFKFSAGLIGDRRGRSKNSLLLLAVTKDGKGLQNGNARPMGTSVAGVSSGAQTPFKASFSVP